jgi:hypothetical protein
VSQESRDRGKLRSLLPVLEGSAKVVSNKRKRGK